MWVIISNGRGVFILVQCCMAVRCLRKNIIFIELPSFSSWMPISVAFNWFRNLLENKSWLFIETEAMELWVLHPKRLSRDLQSGWESWDQPHVVHTLRITGPDRSTVFLWHLNSKVYGRYYSVSNYKFKYTLWNKNNDFRFLTLPPEIRENMSYSIPNTWTSWLQNVL